MKTRVFLLLAGLCACLLSSASGATVLECKKIWDLAPHNAFTDLLLRKDELFCVFREGKDHISPDGSIRILSSTNGEKWASAALIKDAKYDLRDPKIIEAPNQELILYAAGAIRAGGHVSHQSFAWFSKDGRSWSNAIAIGEPDVWIWRVIFREETAYAVGYDTKGEKFTRLYKSADHRNFVTLVSELYNEGQPNETGLSFLQDGMMVCLLRRDGPNANGKFGSARPPYSSWTWKDIGAKIGGPQLITLQNGRLIGGCRLYDGGARTSVVEINKETGKLTELVKLPSGGDCSYPGLVWHKDGLWVSYYSSHEGKTSIYLAKLKLD